MPVSAFERRRFVRVDVNLDVRINRQTRAAMKKLSLGGCLLECNEKLDPAGSIQIEFSCHGEEFTLSGGLIHPSEGGQYGVHFQLEGEELVDRLVSLIQKIQDAGIIRRSTRLKMHTKALLDNKPSLLTDLSEGGCSVKTPHPFNYGDIVEVHLSLENEKIHLAGQVRWKGPGGIGIEFLSPDPTQVDEIATYIVKRTSQPPDA